MKTHLFTTLLLLTMNFFWSFAQDTTQTKSAPLKDSLYYTCSMHPEIQSSEPGKCPKCGMNLIQKTTSSTNMKMCSMHGMVDMNHMHDGDNPTKSKMHGNTIKMGVMMLVMMTLMIVFISTR